MVATVHRASAIGTIVGVIIAVISLPFLLGYLSMTVGVALENSSHLGPFRAYSALYYADHSGLVDNLPCNKAASELVRSPGHEATFSPVDGRRLSPHPLDCLEPKDYPTVLGWCPYIIQLTGYCTSVAFSEDVLRLPGFEDGLRLFLKDPCSLDEFRAREARRQVYAPKEYIMPTIAKNSYCMNPRPIAVYFVNDEDRVTRVLKHFF